MLKIPRQAYTGKRVLWFAAIVVIMVAATPLARKALGEDSDDHAANSAEISANAAAMIHDGRQTFRFDTFGDEAFWGDTLKLPPSHPRHQVRRCGLGRESENRAGAWPEG